MVWEKWNLREEYFKLAWSLDAETTTSKEGSQLSFNNCLWRTVPVVLIFNCKWLFWQMSAQQSEFSPSRSLWNCVKRNCWVATASSFVYRWVDVFVVIFFPFSHFIDTIWSVTWFQRRRQIGHATAFFIIFKIAW